MTTQYRNLRPHVVRELATARAARSRHETAAAWRSLERAHIVSQPSARLHTRVHVAMLALAVVTWDGREVFGQLLRLALAGLGSAVGRYPVGNTGRARVPILSPMPIPADLEAILAQADDPPLGSSLPPRRGGRAADSAG